jgi:signal transduction histidine kinase
MLRTLDPAAPPLPDVPLGALPDAPAPLVTPDLLVAACEPDGSRLHANAAWQAVFGEGETWQRVGMDDARTAATYVADAARGSLVTHQVFLVERPGADLPLPVLLHFIPVRLQDKQPGRFPVVITGEVLQEPVSWAADQTRRRRTEMLGQMTMGVAHDFNNLLTTILGHAELLHTALEGAPEETRAHLAAVERAASDGATLVRKIQQYIRHEKRERFETVDLPALIGEVLALTRPYWHNEPRRQGIAIWVDTDLGEVPPILGFPTELREVFVNLVLNAVQAMPAGGTLRIRTSHDPARGAIVSVEDTGVGMAEHVRSRIFEPLFTTKGERGTGMGLTVAYGIVQEHRGEIEVESEPGQGSRFRLTFPQSDAMLEEIVSVDAPAAAPTRPARVLVVDDEPMVRTVTSKLLRLKGHAVMEADGGHEALRMLGEAGLPPVDLVVTDLSMPDMNGRELAQQIRARFQRLPILLLTGDTDAEAGDGEVDVVVKKPFRLEALEAEIQRLLREAEG